MLESVLNELREEREYQECHAFDDKNTLNDWSARRQLLKVAALAVAAIEAFEHGGLTTVCPP